MASSHFEQQNNKKNKSIISGELVKRITAGDEISSNEFVQINYRWLLFIVRRKFPHSNNHEDILQDTFMLVLTKLQQGSIKNPKAILAYLRTTAINIGFEYLRKDKKVTSALDQGLLDVIEGSQDDVLSTIIWNDKVKYVKIVMSELKEQRDRDILVKFYLVGLDKPSICIELDLSKGHFDKVLYRAKGRLRQLIRKKDNENNTNKPNGKMSPISKNKQNKELGDNFMLRKINNIRVKMNILYYKVVAH